MYKELAELNQYKAWLLLSEFDCSPDTLTSLLGISPTRVSVKGEYIEETVNGKVIRRVNKRNLWVLQSELDETTPVVKHIEAILQKIKSKKKELTSISKIAKIELNCAIYYYDVNPGLHIPTEIMSILSDLDISLYFDIYCMNGAVTQFEQDNAEAILTKQFSEIDSVKKVSDEKHNEARNIATSLIKIDALNSQLATDLEETIIWKDLTSEEFEGRVQKVVESINQMHEEIQTSKILKGNNKSKYGKYILNDKAKEFIKDRLAYSFLPKKKRNTIHFNEGTFFTFLPGNIHEESLYDFETPILEPETKCILDKNGLKYVPIKDIKDALCQYIYDFLQQHKRHRVVFECTDGTSPSVSVSHTDSYEKIATLIKEWYVPGAKGYVIYMPDNVNKDADL